MGGLYLLPKNWYEKNKIDCWLNTQVATIDAAEHPVELAMDETLPYNHLILAMGSRSFIPPIPRFGLDGTFVLREAEDAVSIHTYTQNHRCRRAVVAGGGLLGLEAAYALRKLGLGVYLLERGPWLLRRQLDARGPLSCSGIWKGWACTSWLNPKLRRWKAKSD